MAPHSALLILLALARALSQSDLCEYETNRIKDLLQASCEGKGLTKVPPGLEQGTGILLLGSNHLARVSTASFWHLRNLTDLDLSHNRMEELEATSPLPSLQELDLSHNTLKNLPALQGFPNLVRLALGHNALSWLPEGGFQALGQLVDLELQGNQLQRLPEGAFMGLSALKDLDVSDNRLTVLPPELLAGLGALETLRLERNRLRSVPEGFFPEGHIFAYVYLIGNPWLCDCALEYLRDWITENSFSVYTRVQGPEKEITENQPENVTCHDPPEKLGHPVMDFHLDCRLQGGRGVWGDGEGGRGVWGDGEEIFETQTGVGQTTFHPDAASEMVSTLLFPVTTTAAFTQPETVPSASPTLSLPTDKVAPLANHPHPGPTTHPTTQGSLATMLPPAPGAQAAPAASTSRLPPVPTTATLPALSSTMAIPSTSPTTRGSLATTLSTALGTQVAPAARTPGLPPAPTMATPGPGEPVTTPSTPPQATSTTEASPAPTPTALMLPAITGPGSTAHPVPHPPPDPPAYCQCPVPPGAALGLSGQQPPPVSWGAWLAGHCCHLRLALYVACLLLGTLPALAVLCWWVCEWGGTTLSAQGPQLVNYQQLQKVAHKRHHMPGEGCQPLPRRHLYRVCKRLEMAPFRYVTWLLVSLPGPSGQWPWERKDSFPLDSLDCGKDDLGALQVEYAAAPAPL